MAGYNNRCEICRSSALFSLEWRGFNQHGKDPRLVKEAYSCADLSHLIEIADNDEFGLPDIVYDHFSSEERESPKILRLIYSLGDNRESIQRAADEGLLRKIIGQIHPAQLEFSKIG